jgi:hypothetical protein
LQEGGSEAGIEDFDGLTSMSVYSIGGDVSEIVESADRSESPENSNQKGWYLTTATLSISGFVIMAVFTVFFYRTRKRRKLMSESKSSSIDDGINDAPLTTPTDVVIVVSGSKSIESKSFVESKSINSKSSVESKSDSGSSVESRPIDSESSSESKSVNLESFVESEFIDSESFVESRSNSSESDMESDHISISEVMDVYTKEILKRQQIIRMTDNAEISPEMTPMNGGDSTHKYGLGDGFASPESILTCKSSSYFKPW